MGGGRSMCSDSDAEIAQQVEAFGKKVTSLEEKFTEYQESLNGENGILEKILKTQENHHEAIRHTIDKAASKFSRAFGW